MTLKIKSLWYVDVENKSLWYIDLGNKSLWNIDLGNKKFTIGWPWKYELDVPRQHIQDNGWIVCLGLNNSRQERRVFRKQQRNHKCGSYHLQSMIDGTIMINGDQSMFLNWSYIWKALSLSLSLSLSMGLLAFTNNSFT